MITEENEFDRYRRLRWWRGAKRYWRPDAARCWQRVPDNHLPPALRHLLRPQSQKGAATSAASVDRSRAEQTAWRSEAEELEFRRELASLRFEVALLRFSMRGRKALHHSNFQPRVPRGDPDGGRFVEEGGEGGSGQRTRVAGPPTGRGGGGRYGGYFPGATAGQLARLDQAVARTQNAIAQIRQYDPNWQPRTTSFTTQRNIEGAIRHAEARAEEAIARLDHLRSGVWWQPGSIARAGSSKSWHGSVNSTGIRWRALDYRISGDARHARFVRTFHVAKG